LVIFALNLLHMKALVTFIVLISIITTGFAQKQDIEVFEKKEGSKVIVIARNTGKLDYSVTLVITAKGMDVSPSTKVEAVIPAGFMKEMANLVPRPGESWEYGYEVSFLQSMVKITTKPNTFTTQETQTSPSSTKPTPPSPPPPPTPNLSKADIVLYSKPGCSRCSFTKKKITSLGIAFEEYNTTSDSPEISNMWAQLRNSGFSGGSVTMPVVRANGKYYYNIPDLEGFVAKLKK